MIDFLVAKIHDARFMTMLLAAIAASATAYTLIMPLFAGEGLAKRMKAVASERERIRQRERDRLPKTEKVSLSQTPKQQHIFGLAQAIAFPLPDSLTLARDRFHEIGRA